MMKIKMFVTDMDGTLLNNGLTISPANAAALKKAHAAGIVVVVATGRMFEAAQPHIKKLNLNIPLVTYNGAMVKNSITEEVLFEQTMEPLLAQEIFQFGRHMGLHMHGYWGGEVYTDKLDDSSRWYSAIIKKPIHEIGDALFDEPHATYKILGITKPEMFLQNWNDIGFRFKNKIEVTSSYPTFLEILTPNLNKWTAVKNLAKKFQVDISEIMCVGDSINDLCMLKNVEYSVAVKNANWEVKECAKMLVASNDDDGVAEAVEIALGL